MFGLALGLFSLLVLLRKLGSGFSADQKYLDHVRGSCQETGRDHCFGPVLLPPPPPPPPPPAVAASCALQLAGCIWVKITPVCAKAFQ